LDKGRDNDITIYSCSTLGCLYYCGINFQMRFPTTLINTLLVIGYILGLFIGLITGWSTYTYLGLLSSFLCFCKIGKGLKSLNFLPPKNSIKTRRK